MVPRENKNNAYAKFGGTNKKNYGIIPSGLITSVYDEMVYEMNHIWTADMKSSEVMIFAVMRAIFAIA